MVLRVLLAAAVLAAVALPSSLRAEATPIERMKIAKDFKVELLYSVPKEEQGSWVSMTPDSKGRLYVSDQYGKLYRVTPPGIEGTKQIKIEPVAVEIGHAQGMVWAFDSLYIVLNTREYKSGLYRLRDTDGDDALDELSMLREFMATGGEHGPHAVMLSPDGKTLTVVCGNQTQLTEIDASRVPQAWDEDNLLPRVYGRGFMKGTPAPGGWIAKTDPDGKAWELLAVGFRNEYDAAYSRTGELFAYDADMEWDMNTPWYRPTRVNHVVSGADFGWRNGGGKWPADYPDSLGAVVTIGPGSPTGVTFGYGAKFPAKYQEALFICDWSYGKLYAVHLKADGASFTGEAEEFVTGVPLPLTDIVINPADGAMYFAIGGRRVQSGLYRVTYTGSQSTVRSGPSRPTDLQKLRRELESLHRPVAGAADKAWPHLGHADRHIRHAARVAIEHQPVASWKQRALAESKPDASLQSLLALLRQQERSGKLAAGKKVDLDPPAPSYGGDGHDQSPGQAKLQGRVLAALMRHDWAKLDARQRLDWLRVYAMAFIRLGPPAPSLRQQTIARLDAVFPTGNTRLDAELAQLLVYLQSKTAAAKGVALLEQAPTQEEQIAYAKTLRLLRAGWTPNLRERYFRWFSERGASYSGGMSFGKFMDYIRGDAIAGLSPSERQALQPILAAKPKATAPSPFAGLGERKFVKNYTVSDLAPAVEKGLTGRNFDRGRRFFGAVGCFACHRFDNRGGAMGPDLTGLAGRFGPRDVLESIIEPNKEISDQYGATQISLKNGSSIYGRIINLKGDTYRVNPNMMDPKQIITVDRNDVDKIAPSPISMMPPGLLNLLEEDEVLDLIAYLLSRGDRRSPMFDK
ncbi:MAG: c-type cytochrome [Phycisphaerae bacterium]|nr:c-type cytochrome [Phycisphaerae bacterium]